MVYRVFTRPWEIDMISTKSKNKQFLPFNFMSPHFHKDTMESKCNQDVNQLEIGKYLEYIENDKEAPQNPNKSWDGFDQHSPKC